VISRPHISSKISSKQPFPTEGRFPWFASGGAFRQLRLFQRPKWPILLSIVIIGISVTNDATGGGGGA
jgi:hypothetical protein